MTSDKELVEKTLSRCDSAGHVKTLEGYLRKGGQNASVSASSAPPPPPPFRPATGSGNAAPSNHSQLRRLIYAPFLDERDVALRALDRLIAEKERAERERDEAREREEATRQANLDTMDWFNSLKADYDSLTARLRSVCEALDEINMMACYASEEDVNSREWMLLKIGETTRAALDAAKKEMGE